MFLNIIFKEYIFKIGEGGFFFILILVELCKGEIILI